MIKFSLSSYPYNPLNYSRNFLTIKLQRNGFKTEVEKDSCLSVDEICKYIRVGKDTFGVMPVGGSLLQMENTYIKQFADKLVDACVEMLQEWSPDPAPQWVTCIPSLNHPEQVPDFAARLASALSLPFVPCIKKARANRQQKFMENSYQQVINLDGAFNIINLQPKNYQPCLLVDDIINSGWTSTVASALLRKAGCTKVSPMALALNSPRMN